MTASCLQLLTARRLNDYALPSGWLPCAAVNPTEGYDTRELDPALVSRFVNVEVIPDVPSWLAWAEAHAVHAKIRAFVAQSPDVFSDPAANPRAWTNASKALRVWEQGTRDDPLLPRCSPASSGDEVGTRVFAGLRQPSPPLRATRDSRCLPGHGAARGGG